VPGAPLVSGATAPRLFTPWARLSRRELARLSRPGQQQVFRTVCSDTWAPVSGPCPGREGIVAPFDGSNLFAFLEGENHNSIRWITRLVRR